MGLQDRTRTLRKFMNEHFRDIHFTTGRDHHEGAINDRKATKVMPACYTRLRSGWGSDGKVYNVLRGLRDFWKPSGA